MVVKALDSPPKLTSAPDAYGNLASIHVGSLDKLQAGTNFGKCKDEQSTVLLGDWVMDVTCEVFSVCQQA